MSFDFIRPRDRRVSIRALLLDASADTIVLATELSPSQPVTYRGQTVMDVGYRAVWFLFQGESFDIGRVYRPDGEWTGYYVDILEPVRWAGADPATVEPIVDLFLDLWIAPDGRHLVLDEDEFREAAARGDLTAAQADHARRVLQDLIVAIERGAFPPAVVKNFRLVR